VAAAIGAALIAAAPPLDLASPHSASPDPAVLALLAHSVSRCERAAKPDEIVVCARDREAERQKLPLAIPPNPGDPRNFSVSRERNALIERGPVNGMMSCESAVGPSGEFGCLAREMHRAGDQNPKNWPSLTKTKPDSPPPL